MTNPRKFSEKIAIHQQKQAEGTAAFDEIMRDVNRTRGKDNGVGLTGSPFMKMRARYRGGSLPNIASSNPTMHMAQNQLDLQNALENLQEMQTGRHQMLDNRYNNRRINFGGSRSMPMARSRVETSPYHARLLNPAHQMEQSWRRTNSDSAIHQSLQQRPHQLTQQMSLQQQLQRKQPAAEGMHGSPPKASLGNMQQPSKRPDGLMFPSGHRSMDGGGQSYMQMQASTGSLPDLSSINLHSPQGQGEGEDSINNQLPSSQFSMPLHAAPRRHYASQSCGKQVFPIWQYPLPADASAKEKLQHRMQLYATLGLDQKGAIDPPPAYGQGPQDLSQSQPPPHLMTSTSPASPVSSFHWNTPISPLATEAFTQHDPINVANLQQQQPQQFPQFQPGDSMQVQSEMPYFMQQQLQQQHQQQQMAQNDQVNNMFNMNKYKSNKSNNGLPDIVLPGNENSIRGGDFAHQLGQAMDVGGNGGLNQDMTQIKSGDVSDDALDCVRGGLDPLNFDDVQLLSDANTEVVDSSTENQFRLEHSTSGYQ